VFLTSGYMGSLTAFVVYLLLGNLGAQRPISTIKKVFISVLSSSAYYSMAIIYHGFFPQAAYVPFMLSAGFWYLKAGETKICKDWLSESILLSAVILIYGFVAAIPIIAIIGIQLIYQI